MTEPRRKVYLLLDGNGHLKIGISANPHARVASLQAGTTHKLTLAYVISGTSADESLLHRVFATDRVAGEWFNLSPRLRSFIDFIDHVGGSGVSNTLEEWLEDETIATRQKGFLYDKYEWVKSTQVAA